MKARKIIGALSLMTLGTLIAGAQEQKEKVSVWSFTDEIELLLEQQKSGYKDTHPDTSTEYTMIPTDQFPYKLDEVLQSGKNVPDVIGLEDAFVRRYVESGYLLPLDDVYEEVKKKMSDYPMQIGSYDGHVYAMSWQICPGAMFYRRSLAKKYLGTDDPKKVQKFFSSFDKMLKTARVLKTKSKGKCRLVSSSEELYRPFLSTRKNPWVVNDKLCIDPAMEKYMELCKTLYEEELDVSCGQWSEGWFAGMNDRLVDEEGNPIEIFSYFLPTWGLHYVLKTNAPETSGDWAMCQGPASYYWGGIWLAVCKDSKNPEAAKEMVKYLTTDERLLETYALSTGEYVGNFDVQKKIKDYTCFKEPYLSGQNQYAEFCEYAKKFNGSLVQATDAYMESLFKDSVYAYALYNEMSMKEALDAFKMEVLVRLGY